MTVDIYNSPIDIWVKFNETGDRVHTSWRCFDLGVVRSVFDKTVFGVGFIGKGIYRVTIDGKYTPEYITWSKMLQRCYDKKFKSKFPTYAECAVCEEWHNFQNFAQWYNEHFYQIDGEKIALDKDILVKNNKIYSPKTCIFVPQYINSLFIKCDAKRGDLPIGVSYREDMNKYRVKCSDRNGKQISIGHYNTPTEAFQAYKLYKEKVIKEVAFDYKETIPSLLFESLLKYKVEITD